MPPKIEKIILKSGKVRYRAVASAGFDPDTGKRVQLTITRDRRGDVTAELSRITHQRRTGEYVAPTSLTVNQALDMTLPVLCVDVEEGTASNYRHALTPVRERLGHRALQSLHEQDVDELRDWLLTSGRKRGGQAGTGLGARSVGLTLGILRAALQVAVRRRLVVRNVALDTKMTKDAREKAAVAKAERTPWTSDEVRVFLAGIRGIRLYAPLLLSLLGLRPAEVTGLLWSAIDLEAGTLRVERTRTLVDGRVVEKGTKSKAGTRTLPIPVPVLTSLKAFKVQQAAEKLAAGPAYNDVGYVLADELGMPFRTDQFRREAYRAMAAAGVRKVRLYDARHAALTYLATSGAVPDVVVSAWAGHSDLSFTKRTYVHPDAEHLRLAADAFDRLLG